MTKLNMVKALNVALQEEMERDPDVLILGEAGTLGFGRQDRLPVVPCATSWTAGPGRGALPTGL